MKSGLACVLLLLGAGVAGAATTGADPSFVVKPVAERKVSQLPDGPLYWTVQQCATRSEADAHAAADPASLAVEVAGKVWLLRLSGATASGGCATTLARIGPVAPPAASHYLLRVNRASGAPGSRTPIHSHPGSEAFYVLSGALSQKTPEGDQHATAGQSMNGHRADLPMQVSSSGSDDLDALVMFVVDADRPFSTPAKMP
jgi:quercetin dioxygenase-like cupin family protein